MAGMKVSANGSEWMKQGQQAIDLLHREYDEVASLGGPNGHAVVELTSDEMELWDAPRASDRQSFRKKVILEVIPGVEAQGATGFLVISTDSFLIAIVRQTAHGDWQMRQVDGVLRLHVNRDSG